MFRGRDEIRSMRKGNGSELPLPLWTETSEARSWRVGVSDYLGSQVALAYAARASRAFALRRTSSLRASAMRMTIFSFPLATSLARKPARLLSYLEAISATRNRIEHTLLRPPRTVLLPSLLPLLLAIGATPTSL